MLKVEGVDPARIKCEAETSGTRWALRVRLDGLTVASLSANGLLFGGHWSGGFKADAEAVMIAAFDEWRASDGKRLWPEPPPPRPVDCVCGGRATLVEGDFDKWVECDGCLLQANSVEEWNPMQATLKALKGGAA